MSRPLDGFPSARNAIRRDTQLVQIDDLARRIDDQREGRELLSACAGLRALDRAAIELVDLDGVLGQGSRRMSECFAWCPSGPTVQGSCSSTQRSDTA